MCFIDAGLNPSGYHLSIKFQFQSHLYDVICFPLLKKFLEIFGEKLSGTCYFRDNAEIFELTIDNIMTMSNQYSKLQVPRFF